MYRIFFKQFLDSFLALLGFAIFLPIFIVLVVLLFINNKGKPFFYQNRPGKDGICFNVIKFKTMNDRKDQQGNFLADADRLTSLGAFIRKTSLDEIPQLINVIKGDMSLIGPRPLLPEYLALYNEHQSQRHNVKPGITGWAQINGRNAISWQEKFDLDVWYVNHMSLSLDIKIFFKTILKVFKSEGINQNGQVTMEKFKGNI